MTTPDHPFHCSTCKTPIAFGARHYACGVSTCNRKRTALYFCSVPCFDAHLPEARHRDAWAEEQKAPSAAQWAAVRDETPDSETRTTVPSPTPAEAPRRSSEVSERNDAQSARDQDPLADAPPREILIVVSKLKAYVRARSGMNTSDGVAEALSDHVRRLSDAAIRAARRAGRKTLMDRDFEPPAR